MCKIVYKKALFYEFIKYVGLNVCSMIGMSCYILADTFFIANGVGIYGLTALNLAIPVYGIMTATGIMLGVGTSCKYVIMKGEGREQEGNAVFSHGLICAVVLGILFLMIGFFGSGFLANLVGADETTWELTKTYLQTILFFAPFFVLNNFFNMMVKNDKGPKLAMAAMLCGSFSNIVLDYIFIYPLQWGMFGAALATGIAPVIGLGILLVHKIKRKNQFHWVRIRMKLPCIWEIVTLGTPAFISEVAAAVVVILFNMVMLKQVGNLGVAAYGIIANLAIVVIGIFNGIAQGMQPVISENYGKKDMQNVSIILRYGIFTTVLAAILLYSFLFTHTESIISVFNKDQSAGLAELANSGIKIYFTGIFFAGINILSILYYSAIENIKVSFVTSVLRSGMVIIPLVLVMASVWGVLGIWWSYPVSEAIICMVMIIMSNKYFSANGGSEHEAK